MTIEQFTRLYVYGCTKYHFIIFKDICEEKKTHNLYIDYCANDPDKDKKISEYLDFCVSAEFGHINVESDGYLRIIGYEQGGENNDT